MIIRTRPCCKEKEKNCQNNDYLEPTIYTDLSSYFPKTHSKQQYVFKTKFV